MINLVSFLDEKNNNLQDIRCDFNLNHIQNESSLEIIFDLKRNTNLYKDINEMLYNRYNKKEKESKLKLIILNEYGFVQNKFNLIGTNPNTNYNFADNTVKIKYELI